MCLMKVKKTCSGNVLLMKKSEMAIYIYIYIYIWHFYIFRIMKSSIPNSSPQYSEFRCSEFWTQVARRHRAARAPHWPCQRPLPTGCDCEAEIHSMQQQDHYSAQKRPTEQIPDSKTIYRSRHIVLDRSPHNHCLGKLASFRCKG
jgi:hypothetical protein